MGLSPLLGVPNNKDYITGGGLYWGPSSGKVLRELS